VNRNDRLANAGLLASALSAWLAFGFVALNLDPRADAAVLLAGALLLGAAIGLTLVPLLWLARFARAKGIAYRGDWWQAARRGLLVAFVISLFVILRGQDELSLPLALFILAMAVLAEVTLSLQR
jgi:hypothetical protein